MYIVKRFTFGNMKPVTLALIEDDPVVHKSLVTFLGSNPQFELLTAAYSIESFLDVVQSQNKPHPQIILLDIQLPGMNGIEGIPVIARQIPDADIIMLTTFEDNDRIFAALRAGACSYLSKRTSLVNIQDAIITVSRGGSYMTPGIARKVIEHFNPAPKDEAAGLTSRQRDIVYGILDGLSYKLIAARHDISIDTVRTHIKHIYRMLNINSKGELIRWAMDEGL
jgi:DNA-binding NarL/FixJ family response regulator